MIYELLDLPDDWHERYLLAVAERAHARRAIAASKTADSVMVQIDIDQKRVEALLRE